MKSLQLTDPELYQLILQEKQRQSETLMMIPSENIASEAVEEAVGSCLGNKYAEGYPGKRYYEGQQIVDQIEQLVIDRAKSVFGVPFANVQPHSGSPANFAVYTALMQPGETLMGLMLSSGGHLTHGAKFSATSKYFRSVSYDVNEEGYIDYDALEKLAHQEKPKVIIAGVTAYPRLLDWERFAHIAASVNAYLLADISHLAGLVAAEVYPSPVPFADIVTTTTHKTLRGPRGAMIMVTEKGLKKDAELDKKINKAIIPGIQGGPHLNSIAGIGVALLEATKPSYKTYAQLILSNAQILANSMKQLGFNLITNGTDSHLLLVDLRNFEVLGNTMAEACDHAGIVLNMNGIPHDPHPPLYPSGIRLGTPGLSSRSMGEAEMKMIAHFLKEIVTGIAQTKKTFNYSDESEKKKDIRQIIIEKTSIIPDIRIKVKQICEKFPISTTY